MKSTDHNINNPLIVDTIELVRDIDSFKLPEMYTLTQDEYDLIQIKDPYTIYKITNNSNVYYGNAIVKNKSYGRMYLLGSADKYNEYTLYLNERIQNHDQLIKIGKYDNVQKAIDALTMFNLVGSHNILYIRIFNTLLNYINRELYINDMIIGIISLFGYREDILLQNLIQTMLSLQANINIRDLPIFAREQLHQLKHSNNHLFRFYSDIYDLVIKYNFFEDDTFKVREHELDLSKVINEIICIIN